MLLLLLLPPLLLMMMMMRCHRPSRGEKSGRSTDAQ